MGLNLIASVARHTQHDCHCVTSCLPGTTTNISGRTRRQRFRLMFWGVRISDLFWEWSPDYFCDHSSASGFCSYSLQRRFIAGAARIFSRQSKQYLLSTILSRGAVAVIQFFAITPMLKVTSGFYHFSSSCALSNSPFSVRRSYTRSVSLID